MSTSEGLEIVEQDEAGNVTCTYIASGDSRVDVVVRTFLNDFSLTISNYRLKND